MQAPPCENCYESVALGERSRCGKTSLPDAPTDDTTMTRTARVPDPSFELMDDHEGHSLIYRQHGFHCPLVRWHFHKEYELHLITASSGKVFIGDYIGNFYPESLFL